MHEGHISLYFFCIAENVFSKGLTKMALENKIKLINGIRNLMVHSHTLYAYEIMIFSKGNCYYVFG